ncbi:hypothetical protein EPH_0050280 [Eimeria praecox]|uniref:Uncharacterized protein n=1 Tax=Eimeria praecox TaxID=51316 RepID=U6GLF1_9EIME|nr:hypothetical protein EPH_0050280 [Eimeria praecox]
MDDVVALSFFFCKVVISPNVILRWQWFLSTDTLWRLLSVSKVIVDARWMNILNLSSSPPSALSRAMFFQDAQSNAWLFGLLLLLLLACRALPLFSSGGDDL